MNKEAVRQKIEAVGIIPVVRAGSAEEACLAAEAVRLGGIPIVEITMTVPGALEVIAALAKQCGSTVLIGAGTVRHAEAARNSWSVPGRIERPSNSPPSAVWS